MTNFEKLKPCKTCGGCGREWFTGATYIDMGSCRECWGSGRTWQRMTREEVLAALPPDQAAVTP